MELQEKPRICGIQRERFGLGSACKSLIIREKMKIDRKMGILIFQK